MIRINLLPHREEKRKARRQQFYALAILVSVLAAVIVLAVHLTYSQFIEGQEEVNDILKNEIAKISKEIEEIKNLKEQTQALLARKPIIENLQRDRSEAVRLLSEMTRQMPEGIYIRSLKQAGARVSIAGYAQSSARVSTFMRNVEASPWLEKPQLIEIKAASINKKRLNEFTMNVWLKREAPPENQQNAAKTPARGKK